MFVDRFSQQLTIPSGLKQPEMGGGSLGFQVISTGAGTVSAEAVARRRAKDFIMGSGCPWTAGRGGDER
jgi:hypothetical protein